jgi:formylmethanofuran dehydrogenase subunit E
MTGSKRSWLPEPDPADTELSAKRRRNDERHESRWGSIIDRYSKNFEDVGDEIDLRTGEIVVDRGHLNRMRDEFDNGDGLSSSAHLPSEVLSQMVENYGSESEEDEEGESGSEGGEEDEEDEDDEDELATNWPASSPSSRKRPSPVNQVTQTPLNRRIVVDDDEDEEEEEEEDSEGDDDDDSISAVDLTAQNDIPAVPPVLPDFEMPQMGFGGQLEGAMAAMSTAMGAAIQAQMMAFMNVVLQAQQNGTAPPMSAAELAAAAAKAVPQANMPPPPILPKRSAAATEPRNGTRTSSGKQSLPQKRAAKSKDNAIRQQTPGFGSLWAAKNDRSAGYKKKADKQPKTVSATTSTAKAGPSRITSLNMVRDLESEDSFSDSDITEVPTRRKNVAAAPRAGAYQPTVTKPVARATPTTASKAREKSKAVGRPRTKAVPRVEIEDQSYDDDVPIANYDDFALEPDSTRRPFVVDSDEESDEDDELTTLTPPTVSKPVQGPPYPPVDPIRGAGPVKIPRRVPGTDFTAFAGNPSLQPGSGISARPIQGAHLQDSRSRSGLRNRKPDVRYDEQAAFDEMLEGLDSDDARRTTTTMRKRNWQNDLQPVERDWSPAAPPFQSGPDLVQYELPPAGYVAPPPPLARPLNNQKDTGAQAAPKAKEYVYTPRPHLHKYQLPARPGQSPPPGPKRPKRSDANISKPRTIKPPANITALQLYASLTREEIEQRHELVKGQRRGKFDYDDKPPPLPCAHCRCTTSTAWAPNPEGGDRRLCNACNGYTKRNKGQKRPLVLEEFRNLTHKAACENCAKMTVSSWMSRVVDKRLCKPCGRYAKRHGGKMKPVPQPPSHDCERCGHTVNNIFTLSNRARVCLDCHNFLFSDYNPRNDPDAPMAEDTIDPGESFFDRCLLIFTYNFLATAPIGRRSINNCQNAKQAPCKLCHEFTASGWRPALDQAMICEVCYTRVMGMIDKYKMYEFLQREDWDAPFEIEGVVTDEFECAKCEEEIESGRWRGDEELGVVLCTPCFQRKHDGKAKNRDGTAEVESNSAEDEENTEGGGGDGQSPSTSRENTVDAHGTTERRSASLPAREDTEYFEARQQTVPSTSSDRGSVDSVLLSRDGTVDAQITGGRMSAPPVEREEAVESEMLPQHERSSTYERDPPAPVAVMVVDDSF